MPEFRPLKILSLPLLCLSAITALAQQPATDPIKSLTPVTDEMLRNPPPGDWLMWRRTYDGWGYSPLDQINKDNVKNLRPAWTWSLVPASPRSRRSCTTACCSSLNAGDKIQALNAATGDLLWEYAATCRQAAGRRSQHARQAQHGALRRQAHHRHLRRALWSRSRPRPARWSGTTRSPTGPKAGAIPAARSSPAARLIRA